ncbi:5668_t:CDS:2 [Funneliformis caledonium]|uniref:5668_t:CDS:1 n=1 Tax=Funneliformis caledonium TaxID=1117310 RepID=A0A9N9CHV0_9GLOM|nr:5668_t:CDS:2 [Funneliformis caledonium]
MVRRKSKKSFVENTSELSKKMRYTKTFGTPKSSTRRHVTCDCNLCKGRKVDPLVKESANQINVSDDSVDVDIGGVDSENNDSSAEKTQFSHSRIDFPLAVTEQYNSDEDRNVNEDIYSKSGYDDKDFDVHNADINQGFTWIVYWIFKFQERNRLSDTATNALIKFMRYLLVLIDTDSYSKFPIFLYMTCKLFGISDQIIKYATCKKCCKLYAVKDLPADRPYHYTFQDYPNHPMTSLRFPCNDIVTKQIPTNKGSLHSSKRHIEPELLKIVQRYVFLDELSTYANGNQHLSECLSYIAFKETVGSLAAHNDFDLKKYFEFLSIVKDIKDKAGVGSEAFPGILLKLTKQVDLLSEVLELLVKYYQSAYDCSFISLSNIHNSTSDSRVVLPKVKYFGRLRIGAEVIGSTYSVRHIRSVNILSQFSIMPYWIYDMLPILHDLL